MTKNVDKVEKITSIPNEDRIQQLKQLFPECVHEGEIDLTQIEKTLNLCGGGQP